MKTTPERVTPEQFKNWIFDPPAGPKLVSITPDIAYEALIYNDENHQRPLSQGTISEYSYVSCGVLIEGFLKPFVGWSCLVPP